MSRSLGERPEGLALTPGLCHPGSTGPGALLRPHGPHWPRRCPRHQLSVSISTSQPDCPKGHRFRAQSRNRHRAPLFTRSGTLRQVFLQGRRIARSAPHNSFEFNCHLQSGRPAPWGAGLWRSGWLGGQPQGRRTAVVCALGGVRLPRRRASRPLGEHPQGSALTPVFCHPGWLPGGVTQ